jgi:hypothetical protein
MKVAAWIYRRKWDHSADSIGIPADRNCKRSNLVGGIAADGTALTPIVVLPGKTIGDGVPDRGYTDEKAAFHYQEERSIVTGIFANWIRCILLPFARMPSTERPCARLHSPNSKQEGSTWSFSLHTPPTRRIHSTSACHVSHASGFNILRRPRLPTRKPPSGSIADRRCSR